MIADPNVQLRVLDLQSVDTALSQLAHRRTSLPELAIIADCESRAAELRLQLVEAETAVADLESEQRRLESDIDTVRQRADKDQQRLVAVGVPAKEVAGLQHEVASLARRQSSLEDELLDLMERREAADADVARLSAQVAEIAGQRAAAEAERDRAWAAIDADVAMRTEERAALSADLPADLAALYDKIRQANGGVGAAMLKQRRCEGCRLELAGNELSAVRSAKADEVLRCENCRRILIRTAESGL